MRNGKDEREIEISLAICHFKNDFETGCQSSENSQQGQAGIKNCLGFSQDKESIRLKGSFLLRNYSTLNIPFSVTDFSMFSFALIFNLTTLNIVINLFLQGNVISLLILKCLDI